MLTLDYALEKLDESEHQSTNQRKRVLERCFEHDGHFTADDLLSDATTDYGSLSRATVYNTLPLLVEIGVLRELPESGSSSLYELNRPAHPHARCTECGELVDIDFDLEESFSEAVEGFKPSTVHVIVEGQCAECRHAAA